MKRLVQMAGQRLKTESSIRKLSILDIVLTLLSVYREEALSLGTPAHPDFFATWLRRFANKHNFPAISPHSREIMPDSYLIAAGVDLTTVASRWGYNSSTATKIVYAHLLHSAERKSAGVMNDILQNN